LLTDDQDELSNSLAFMPKVQSLITSQGTTFKSFVPDATCCPSRAAILSGRYPRNTGVFSNDLGCGGTTWQDSTEPFTVAVTLHDAGYHTGLIGKYQNQYGMRNPGLLTWVPPGWDTWYAQAGAGFYYNYNISNQGVQEVHGNSYANDYSTDLFMRKGIDFLQNHSVNRPNDPFFLYMALIAPHQPEVAPQYVNSLPGIAPPIFADIYDIPNPDTHWFTRNAGVYGPYTQNGKDLATYQYRRRVLSLLSADDAIEAIINKVGAIGELDNTYIFFMSDNGYHFLDYGMLQGNFMPYERDVRVPFQLRGPGIPQGLVLTDPFVLSIDMAPTILDLADIAIPDYMDGQTVLPWLDAANIAVGPNPGGDFLIAHVGQVAPARANVPCALTDLTCGRLGSATLPPLFTGTPECACQDGKNNTYNCLRILTPSVNVKYCEFIDNDNFRELYDINADPHEAHNIYSSTLSSSPATIATYAARLATLGTCVGPACRTRPYPALPCASSPCQNSGVCHDGPNYSHTCTCPAGWTGANCEIDIDECAAHPCVNGGTCSTPNFNSYQCACPAGWTGVNCQTDIDECAAHPCVNGGVCSTPNFNSYQCTCPSGWTGVNCQTDIDECAAHPCQNGGVCSTPNFNSYLCTCAAGYSGVNCQTDIDECAAAPCLNGGTCTTPVINSFSCACAHSWTGPTCAEHGNDKDKGTGDDDYEGDKGKDDHY
jgi:N-acetylglucosamine-6-sulfatase